MNYFDKEVYDKIPIYFEIQAFLFFIFEVCASLLLVNNHPSVMTTEEQKTVQKSNYQLKDALVSRYFLTIYSIAFLIYLPSSYMNINLKPFILSRINDDHLSVYVTTASTFFVIISRFIAGLLFDKMKIINLLKFFLFLMIIGNVVFNQLGYTEFYIYLGYIIFSIGDGGSMLVFATSFNVAFDELIAAKLYSVKGSAVLICIGIISVLQYILFAFGWDFGKLHLFLIVLGSFWMILAYTIPKKYNIIGKK